MFSKIVSNFGSELLYENWVVGVKSLKPNLSNLHHDWTQSTLSKFLEKKTNSAETKRHLVTLKPSDLQTSYLQH